MTTTASNRCAGRIKTVINCGGKELPTFKLPRKSAGAFFVIKNIAAALQTHFYS
jgi:hypothetical protein